MGEDMLLFLRLIFVHLMWSSSVAFFSCKKHNVVLHVEKKILYVHTSIFFIPLLLDPWLTPQLGSREQHSASISTEWAKLLQPSG